MKTKPHGNGMTHNQVVRFSNRLAFSANHFKDDTPYSRGWEAACKYFAHELRENLRYFEKINDL